MSAADFPSLAQSSTKIGASLVTALLVIFSPTDSVPTAWAGTLLTATLVIAAIVSKANGNLTLHHATLVLNFATLSCISTLAVAPILPIWRLSPGQYFEQERERHALLLPEAENSFHDRKQELFESAFSSNIIKDQVKQAQRRGRLVLSLAILIQVVLQWTWGIYLFVSWNYSQPECNGDTILLIFMMPIKTRTIDSVDRNKHRFFIWPVWLLFCLSITFTLVVILTLSNSYRSLSASFNESRAEDVDTAKTSATPAYITWQRIVCECIPSREDRRGLFAFCCNVISLVLWCMFVAASEIQMRDNCVFYGENSFGGLGQITAAGVSVVPLWSLCMALYKYPALRAKQKRHLAHIARLTSSSEDHLPRTGEVAGLSAVSNRMAAARKSRHRPLPSDASATSTIEVHEMQPMRARLHAHDGYAYSQVSASDVS
ncbi:hypothetical protein PsYK624_087310 [Phanerochaete sordida]|uniref:Uncharacterized protein n=1 Tax=Phanerochaete sordida TaxID=48140 RepID=A0A9P3LEI9_9APHY|nr:hypothetical protein PsYK624_087310 [Phanerochaete sordida]